MDAVETEHFWRHWVLTSMVPSLSDAQAVCDDTSATLGNDHLD